MRRPVRASSRWTCWSRERTSCRSFSARSRRSGHAPRVIGVYRRADLPVGTRDVVLGLWHVSDPGNVGTLLRTADAFGAGVSLSAECADPTGPRALRASAGAIFRVPLVDWRRDPRAQGRARRTRRGATRGRPARAAADVPARRGARGAAGEPRGAVPHGDRSDPGRRGVVERRGRRRDCAVRARAALRDVTPFVRRATIQVWGGLTGNGRTRASSRRRSANDSGCSGAPPG